MGLKDDMDALERHIRNGTGRQFLEGTAKPIPVDTKLPPEPAPQPNETTYQMIARRGD